MEGSQAFFVALLQSSYLLWAVWLGGITLLLTVAKAHPSRLTFALVFLPVPLLLLDFAKPGIANLIHVYNPLLVLLLLADGLLLSVRPKKLVIRRALNRKLSIGQVNTVSLSVSNPTSQAVRGLLWDTIPEALGNTRPANMLPIRIEGASTQSVSYQIIPTRRGETTFGPAHLRYKSHLGLLWLMCKDAPSETVIVWPDLKRIRQLRIRYARGISPGELQRKSLGLEGTQFSGLRSYSTGDDLRKVAWSATARADSPVIRTFEPEAEQPILVLIDAGRKMMQPLPDTHGLRLQKFDWALNAALSFMAVALERKDGVGVGLFSNRVHHHIPVGGGPGHLNRILEALGQAEPEAIEPNYQAVMPQFTRSLRRRSLVVVLTDLIDPIASRSLLKSLRHVSSHHLLMVVTLADEATQMLASRRADSPIAAYEKGIALDLLQARQQALGTLAKTRQAIIIDTPPSRLDEAMIQRYLSLKQRGLF